MPLYSISFRYFKSKFYIKYFHDFHLHSCLSPHPATPGGDPPFASSGGVNPPCGEVFAPAKPLGRALWRASGDRHDAVLLSCLGVLHEVLLRSPPPFLPVTPPGNAGRGPPFASSGGVNPPCGEVFAPAKTLGRAFRRVSGDRHDAFPLSRKGVLHEVLLRSPPPFLPVALRQ